jgi:D-lactate dehydrogenase
MKVAVFSAHKFEKAPLEAAAKTNNYELIFLEPSLSVITAGMANGCEAVCIFVNDDGSAEVLRKLSETGIKYLLLRSAGFNHVDLEIAHSLKMKVARVPEYSPYAIAEHTIALMLSLNRKLVKAHNRIRDMNFSLDGLTGFDMNGKRVGIIGTGKIGKIVAGILQGFGCNILAHDLYEDQQWAKDRGVQYVSLESLCRQSDIITLHAPLTEQTKYILNKKTIALMKKGIMIINTSRGALVNTKHIIIALKTGHIGYLGLDVYEEEKGLFFEDHSEEILQDDIIARLLSFPNVLITSHQAFLTDTALQNIAETTMANLDCFEKNGVCENEL